VSSAERRDECRYKRLHPLPFSKPAERTTVNSSNIQITTSGNRYPVPGPTATAALTLRGQLLAAESSTAFELHLDRDQQPAGLCRHTSAPTSTSFTTAALPDYSTPTATLDFAYGVTGIATNASFTCHYSTAMDPSSVNMGTPTSTAT